MSGRSTGGSETLSPLAGPKRRPYHHFTVDVEEYFHPTALAAAAPTESWDELPRRSTDVIPRILGLLAERRVRGTFFVLGWLARREAAMVRSIAAAGHEIASHSWDHRLVRDQSPREFRSSVRRTKEFLEDLTGNPVAGFRAPSFSITPGHEWALDVLIEEGYRYDSSLFPVSQHPGYGYPEGERDPWWVERPSGPILEIPPSTLDAFGTILPASGGAYLRFFPSLLIHGAFRQAEERGTPGTFYIHPWEMDDYVPDLKISPIARLRTFGRTSTTWKKVRKLLENFEFEPMKTTMTDMENGASFP